MENKNSNTSLKKRIAAASIATLMAFSGTVSLNKNYSDKVYADSNLKKITKEEAIKMFGEDAVRDAENKANQEIISSNVKEEVYADFLSNRYVISYETGRNSAIESFINGHTELQYSDIYNAYSGFIDKNGYEQGFNREMYVQMESSKNFDYPYQKSHIEEEFKKSKTKLIEDWKEYVVNLKNPTTLTDSMTISLALANGQYDALKGMTDYESSDVYKKYKEYVNEDIYNYCYNITNSSVKTLSNEYSIDMKNMCKNILNEQINLFDEHISKNGPEKDKWVMYYSGFEVGYADEYYKINNQEEKVVGVSSDCLLLEGNIKSTLYNNYYEGYCAGSDQRDKDCVEENFKAR